MIKIAIGALALFLLNPTTGLSAPCEPGKIDDSGFSFTSFRTGYYPDDSAMEGGFYDRKGFPLRTLQSYLAGKEEYVSVAMDHTDARFPYGTKLRIPEIELIFGRCIEFRVVDTGGWFEGRGTEKIDICNDTLEHTLGAHTNGNAKIYRVLSL